MKNPLFASFIISLLFCFSIQAKLLEVWYIPGYSSPTIFKHEAKMLKQEEQANIKSLKKEWEELFKQSTDSLKWFFEDANVKIRDGFYDKENTKDLSNAIANEAKRIVKRICNMKAEDRQKSFLWETMRGLELLLR